MLPGFLWGRRKKGLLGGGGKRLESEKRKDGDANGLFSAQKDVVELILFDL